MRPWTATYGARKRSTRAGREIAESLTDSYRRLGMGYAAWGQVRQASHRRGRTCRRVNSLYPRSSQCSRIGFPPAAKRPRASTYRAALWKQPVNRARHLSYPQARCQFPRLRREEFLRRKIKRARSPDQDSEPCLRRRHSGQPEPWLWMAIPGDAEVVRQVRSYGRPFPIGTHDFHSNVTAGSRRRSDVLITYKENPL
jgi:hypothetical protein